MSNAQSVKRAVAALDRAIADPSDRRVETALAQLNRAADGARRDGPDPDSGVQMTVRQAARAVRDLRDIHTNASPKTRSGVLANARTKLVMQPHIGQTLLEGEF